MHWRATAIAANHQPANVRRAYWPIVTRRMHWKLCREIASDPFDITEQTFCERFIPKLERMLGGPPASRPGNPWPSTSLMLINDGQRVEQQVLSHYGSEGWQGYWCENDLICGLFGLLFWQQIFADLPGAFNQPFQRGPLDLNSSAFYRRRRNLFEARFEGTGTTQSAGGGSEYLAAEASDRQPIRTLEKARAIDAGKGASSYFMLAIAGYATQDRF